MDEIAGWQQRKFSWWNRLTSLYLIYFNLIIYNYVHIYLLDDVPSGHDIVPSESWTDCHSKKWVLMLKFENYCLTPNHRFTCSTLMSISP